MERLRRALRGAAKSKGEYMENNNDAKLAFLKSLNRIQGTIGSAKKDKANPHFKSSYASLTAVNEAVMGPLTEGGFVLLSGGVDIGGKPYLKTTLYHIGGHSESFDYPLVNDGNPQHLASSLTYARRYSICALLNLDVEDDDGNAAVPVKTEKTVTPQVAATFEKKPVEGSVNGSVVSTAQAKRFYAIARANGKTDDDIKEYIRQNFNGAERTEAITKDRYNEACVWAGDKPAEVPF